MTDDERVYKTLATVGVPGTKDAWSVGKAPPLPWFVYERRKGGITKADNRNYHTMPRYTARLYVKENDPDLVAAFEDAVGSLCASFEPHRNWVESEGCMEHLYLFTLLPLKEE